MLKLKNGGTMKILILSFSNNLVNEDRQVHIDDKGQKGDSYGE